MSEISMENDTLSPLLDFFTQTNSTQKEVFIARTDGMLLSYLFLIFAALLCVYTGSYRSIICKSNQKISGAKPNVLTVKNAALLPFIASGFLFGIYLVISFVSKEYLTFVLNIYFFFIGNIALYRVLHPFFVKLRLSALDKIRQRKFHITLTENISSNTTETGSDVMHLDFNFDFVDIGALVLCVSVGVWYVIKRHWIANNIFGIAFSINAIELLHFNKVLNGVVLLSGLFVYDIFWVFGTNVMVTVAKSFDVPIKLLFPQDLIESGLFAASNFTMLGLGDIVVPGAFIALLLRYDMSRGDTSKQLSNIYFNVSFIAYVIALIITIFILQIFKHAQPALLYIVPLCLILPLLTAFSFKDWTNIFAYEDYTVETKYE